MKNESLIVKFFENTLSAEELKEFNELMANDEGFRKEVEFRNELQDVITLDDREQIKKEIQNWDTPKNKLRFKPWQIAASILVLLGVSAFWFLSRPALNPEALFATHFKPYRNVVQPIVRGDDSMDVKSLAFSKYEKGLYQDALDDFNSLLEDSDDATIKFYKANTLLQIGQTEKAIIILEDNLVKTDSLLEKHQWYLALAYMKIGKFEASKEQLNHIINNLDSEYKKAEARALVKKLK